MDKHTKEQRHKNMQAVKNKNTKLENLVCKTLWHRNIRFRKNVLSLKGKPDIAIKKYKIVIFVDSCFWHKCPVHYKAPGTNNEFWDSKITGNMNRDIDINKYYNDKKWHILRVWEHEIKEDFNSVIEKIVTFIEKAKKDNSI